MAWRLNDLVVRGEISNTEHYRVHGWLELRGQERALHLDLTGNCSPDLRGRRVRFEARTSHRTTEEGADLSGLAWHQIGVTGDMTAGHKVRVFDCSAEEFLRRSKL